MVDLAHFRFLGGLMSENRINTILDELHHDLGFGRLNPIWAKFEIALGLFGSGAGVFLMILGIRQRGMDTNWMLIAVGLVLWILGGYLTLAGHRSHFYQSSNVLTAYLIHRNRKTESTSNP